MGPRPMRVLCIVQDTDRASRLEQMLAQDTAREFVLTPAFSVAAGVALRRSERPAAMLVEQPPASAADLAALHEADPGAPILVLAARDDQAAVLEAMRAGIHNYLVAPELSGHGLSRAVWNAVTRQEALPHTARRRAEERLRVSQAHLEEAERLAHLGHWNLDLATDQVSWSDELFRIFGLEPDEGSIPRAEIIARVHPDDRQRIGELMERTVREGESYQTELRIVRADGSIGIVEYRGVVERDAAGVPVRVYGTTQDITERKQAEEARRQSEERLRQAQRLEAIGVLAGGVAHDFNNLLTVIIGLSEHALAHIGRQSSLRPALNEMLKAGERGAALTRQLLAFSRQQVLEPTAVDLNAVVGATEHLLRRVLGEDIKLAASLAPQLGRVFADPRQLELVILNLAANARDAMPSGGRLTIATEEVELDVEAGEEYELPPGPYVVLRVSDTGTGMDAQTAARIFEPFFTTKEVGTGTGLGLATAFGIVKQSGGMIRVDTAPGQGATFTVYLPRAAAFRPDDPPSVGFEGPPRGDETILLVEDDLGVCAMTGRML